MIERVGGRSPEWTSGHGFLLAALGAAVGLGNIWRFSYVAGENGGGAFIIAYLVAVLALGWPLLVAELAIGRSSRGDAVSAFTRIAPARPWRWTGWIGLVAAVAILSYYPVVAGWVVNYLWFYVQGTGWQTVSGDHAARFQQVISDPVHALSWFAVVMVLTIATVAAGIERGIERTCTVLMPVFIVLLVLLAGYGLSLEGAGRAMTFLFAPEWSALLKPQTYLAAVGQAFFSIGLGMGVLVTYGSYVPSRQSLPRAALLLVIGDTLIALVAGLMIFPAVFTYGVDPAYGSALAFVALPEVFAAMPGGRWFAIAFFLLLSIAALTSAISLLEVPVALVVARWGWGRCRAALVVGPTIAALGVPVALGHGILAPTGAGHATLLDHVDRVSSNLLLPLSAISVALLVGWAWSSNAACNAAGLRLGGLGVAWHTCMRIVVPPVIGLVMIKGLGWI